MKKSKSKPHQSSRSSKPHKSSKPRIPRKRMTDVYEDEEDEQMQGKFDQVESLDMKDTVIASEDDEEIDEEEAFDSEDEKKWGELFTNSSNIANKIYPNRKQQSLLESEHVTEESETSEQDSDWSAWDEEDDEGQGVYISDLIDLQQKSEKPLEQLHDLIDSLDTRTQQDIDRDSRKRKRQEFTSTVPEGEFNVEPGKLSLKEMLGALDGDKGFSQLKKKVKSLESDKRLGGKQALAPPLARRLQQKLDRAAAKEQTHKDVSKWQPLVKKQREAEHLKFHDDTKHSLTHSALAGNFAPSTDLEKDIDKILQMSEMTEEAQAKYEELQTANISPQELKARRAELAKMRSLMFHQEAKLKRAAKIKSKAYRKIKKMEKEKEKTAAMEELRRLDPEAWREEQLRLEAQRAKERATLRHKNTGGWAKQMLKMQEKDPNSRKALMEQLQHHERLTKRIVGDDGSQDSDVFSDASDAEDIIKRGSRALQELEEEEEEAPKGLMAMKFMQKAMEAEKQQTNLSIGKIRRALERGEEIEDDFEEAPTQRGRLVFSGQDGPLDVPSLPLRSSMTSLGSKGDSTTVLNVNGSRSAEKISGKKKVVEEASLQESSVQESSQSEQADEPIVQHHSHSEDEDNPWLKPVDSHQRSLKQNADANKHEKALAKLEQARKKNKRDEKAALNEYDVELDTTSSQALIRASHQVSESESGEEDGMVHVKNLTKMSQKDLLQLAFATDDVLVEDFEREKQLQVEQDAPKVEDGFLPGWGSWTGRGLKNRGEKKRKDALKAKQDKLIQESAQQRQDNKLKHVIINEKKQKKAVKYMSESVPYPFETREQYEASMKVPLGPEWNTVNVFASKIKPRVQTKQGHLIKPMKMPGKH